MLRQAAVLRDGFPEIIVEAILITPLVLLIIYLIRKLDAQPGTQHRLGL